VSVGHHRTTGGSGAAVRRGGATTPPGFPFQLNAAGDPAPETPVLGTI
jgi:hypothetical protein